VQWKWVVGERRPLGKGSGRFLLPLKWFETRLRKTTKLGQTPRIGGAGSGQRSEDGGRCRGCGDFGFSNLRSEMPRPTRGEASFSNLHRTNLTLLHRHCI